MDSHNPTYPPLTRTARDRENLTSAGAEQGIQHRLDVREKAQRRIKLLREPLAHRHQRWLKRWLKHHPAAASVGDPDWPRGVPEDTHGYRLDPHGPWQGGAVSGGFDGNGLRRMILDAYRGAEPCLRNDKGDRAI